VTPTASTPAASAPTGSATAKTPDSAAKPKTGG
jgi:hypothetical protein